MTNNGSEKRKAKSEKDQNRMGRYLSLCTFRFSLVAGLLSASGCTDWAGYDLDYLWSAFPVLSTMRSSIAYDPYDMPRLPPEGSVPLSTPNGNTPPPFAPTQLDSAAATLANPFAAGASAAVLARGQFVYNTQCSVCHGPQGAGNGTVIGPGKFPFAPPINNGARSDGYIYAIVTVGRGLMPAYGEKVTHTDRWAVASYVRNLSGGAAPAAAAPAPAPPAATPTAPAANPNAPSTEPAAAPAAGTGAQPPQ
jgi:mono/diheme cytochrome c family protein